MEAQVYLQETLRVKLDELKLKNSSFSLRSFAKMLEVSPASLSEFLNGKRKLSPKMINKVVDRLCLSPQEQSIIQDKIERDIKGVKHIPNVNKEVIQLKNDQYFIVADWHYYAIFYLTETHDFKDDYQWMAQRLKTSVPNVIDCVERLMRMNLLTYDKDGRLKASNIEFFTTEDVPNTSLRRRHAENLDAAKESLLNDDVLDRDFSFITMAINKKKLPAAKKMIREFQDKLVNFLNDDIEKNEVYEICMQMFPRTSKPEKGNNNEILQ